MIVLMLAGYVLLPFVFYAGCWSAFWLQQRRRDRAFDRDYVLAFGSSGETRRRFFADRRTHDAF